ncbi:unnamed protein product, partial [Prorocentrum cordatum]
MIKQASWSQSSASEGPHGGIGEYAIYMKKAMTQLQITACHMEASRAVTDIKVEELTAMKEKLDMHLVIVEQGRTSTTDERMAKCEMIRSFVGDGDSSQNNAGQRERKWTKDPSKCIDYDKLDMDNPE